MLSVSNLIGHPPSPVDGIELRDLFGRPSVHRVYVMMSFSLAVFSWAYLSTQAKSLVRCPVCDYNLAGNVTGICSECGSDIPQDQRDRLALPRIHKRVLDTIRKANPHRDLEIYRRLEEVAEAQPKEP